jgi:SAM dependent carboxyl methyltransferase
MVTSTSVREHGVMEGKGAYNQHAKLPAGGGALALPLWEKAVGSAGLEPGDRPIVIADYGSSQGKNSLAPMRVAIRKLRERLGPDRAISVFHIDQPSNDFNSLFEVLDTDPDSYVQDEPNVFPCAIGKSFYKKVLPPECVHLGWCSYAAVWLSRIPARIPGHFIAVGSTGAEGAAFKHQAAQDWETFLSLRASELRPGGRLVVVLPALDDDGVSGFEDLMNQANAVLGDMVHEGAIRPEERERMVLGAYPRRRCDLLAPFQQEGRFQGLSVESCDLLSLADPIWADYERDGDNEVRAARHALFFRSTFVPSLAFGLNGSEDGEQRRIFADRLENGLKRRLANQSAPLHSFVQALVVAKQGSVPADAAQNEK